MKRLAQAMEHEDEPPSSKAKVNQEGKGKFMGKGKGKFKGKGKLFMMVLQQYEGHPEVCVYRKPAKKARKSGWIQVQRFWFRYRNHPSITISSPW